MPLTPAASYRLTYDRDVYVSFAPQDQQWVKQVLLPRLDRAGLSVLLEDRDFEIGVPHIKNVERAIDRSRHTLAIMTPEFLESSWNEFDTLLLQSADPSNRRRRLLPLMLEPCLLPARIGMLDYATLTGSDEQDEAELERVLLALQKRSNIFIAYAPDIAADRMLAGYLRMAFEDQGHLACGADETMPGHSIEESRRRFMEQCEYVVVLISAGSLQGETLLQQLEDARGLGKTRLLPVRVNYEGALPPEILRHVQDRSFAVWQEKQEPELVAGALLNSIIEFGRLERTRLGAQAKLWPNGAVLRVGFMDGSPEQKWRVAQAASEWLEYANLRMHFTDDPGAPLRVSFAKPVSWAYIGSDALKIPPRQATINFGWIEEGPDQNEVTRVVLHEFGHVLGLIHEHQMPNAEIPWNRQKVEEYYTRPPNHMTRQWVEETIFRRVASNYFHITKPFDINSIMIFPIPKALTNGDFEVGWNRQVSPIDKEFIAKLYPAL